MVPRLRHRGPPGGLAGLCRVGGPAGLRSRRDDAIWGMREADGPTSTWTSHPYSVASGPEGKERDIRVVVTCLGGTSVDVTVRDVDTSQPAVGSLHVDCRGPDATTIAKVFTLRHPEYIVEVQPRGEMWLARDRPGPRFRPARHPDTRRRSARLCYRSRSGAGL